MSDREHFEGHGNKWDAFSYFKKEESFTELLQYAAQNGEVLEQLKSENSTVVPIIYPGDNPLGVCLLLKVKDKGYEVASMYPFLEGLPSKILLEEKHTWKNGLEGDVEGRFADTISIPFFAPFYHKQFLNLKLNAEYEVFFGALAYSVENVAGQGLDIEKGPVFDMHLEQFLKENPSKTQKDCSPAVMKLDGMSAFLPTKYFSEVEYRSPILQIEKTELYGVKTYQAKICVFRNSTEENNDLFLNLYIPETILNGYEPKVGDDIAGIMWLSGYLKF